MKKLSSTVGIVLAILYLLIAFVLVYDAWDCRMMMCDILLSIFTIPTFLITAFLFDLTGWGDPSIAHINDLSSLLDIAAVSLNIVGNMGLIYLIGLGIEKTVRLLVGWMQK